MFQFFLSVEHNSIDVADSVAFSEALSPLALNLNEPIALTEQEPIAVTAEAAESITSGDSAEPDFEPDVPISASESATLTETATVGVALTDGDPFAFGELLAPDVNLAAHDPGTLGEAISIGLRADDSGTQADTNTVGLNAGDQFSVNEPANVAAAVIPNDGATLGERATNAVTLTDGDAGTLGEIGATSVGIIGGDGGVMDEGNTTVGQIIYVSEGFGLSESVSEDVAVSGNDSGTQTDRSTSTATGTADDSASVIDPAGVGIIGGDAGTLDELTASEADVTTPEDRGRLTEPASIDAAVAPNDGAQLGELVNSISTALTAGDSSAMTDSEMVGIGGVDFATETEEATLSADVRPNDRGTLNETGSIDSTLLAGDSITETEEASDTVGIPGGPWRIIPMKWQADTRIACLWGITMAYRNDAEIASGEDVQMEFEPVTPPQDIAAWSLLFVLKRIPTENETFAELPTLLSKTTAGGGIVITDGTVGEYAVLLTSDDTLDVGPGVFAYEVWRTDTDTETRIADGILTIDRTVRLFS